jgi:hypothetical protein
VLKVLLGGFKINLIDVKNNIPGGDLKRAGAYFFIQSARFFFQ